ncbi:hypothetical protein [Acinetobacter chinensis]|uniref:hypothetical protein n=1 Tax=Acinetobacter chinensis TaxID=2004650 RepID=UPI0029353024|nr:hypothetical protein [Acinetobacter chinensis]WOE40675.1 hypothetical protein QSG87_12375 [Acinetobacter chinensis]
MDIQKEKRNYLAMLVAEDAITQEQCNNLSLHTGGKYFYSYSLASSTIDCINWGWQGWLKAPTVPDEFVLVPRVITDEWMAVHIDSVVAEYCKSYEGLSFSVEESELPEIRENLRLPIRNAHKRLMQVIEAQEQSHD